MGITVMLLGIVVRVVAGDLAVLEKTGWVVLGTTDCFGMSVTESLLLAITTWHRSELRAAHDLHVYREPTSLSC
jgi:hypothetical protein